MKIPLFHVDAFTSRIFGGNPAAVCPLDSWLDDATMQAIAAENNLAETAFLVGGGGAYEIRWMTPTTEADLCGHATLASGWVVMSRLESGRAEVTFASRSGPLKVVRQGELLELFAPALGIPEDPVTGSAHCTLVPYWAARLGKDRVRALQVSARGGELFCEQRGDRVLIAGRAVPFLSGTIELPR